MRDYKQEMDIKILYVNASFMCYYYTVTETVFLRNERKYWAKCVKLQSRPLRVDREPGYCYTPLQPGCTLAEVAVIQTLPRALTGSAAKIFETHFLGLKHVTSDYTAHTKAKFLFYF